MSGRVTDSVSTCNDGVGLRRNIARGQVQGGPHLSELFGVGSRRSAGRSALSILRPSLLLFVPFDVP